MMTKRYSVYWRVAMRRPPTRPKMRTWRFMMGCEEVYPRLPLTPLTPQQAAEKTRICFCFVTGHDFGRAVTSAKCVQILGAPGLDFETWDTTMLKKTNSRGQSL